MPAPAPALARLACALWLLCIPLMLASCLLRALVLAAVLVCARSASRQWFSPSSGGGGGSLPAQSRLRESSVRSLRNFAEPMLLPLSAAAIAAPERRRSGGSLCVCAAAAVEAGQRRQPQSPLHSLHWRTQFSRQCSKFASIANFGAPAGLLAGRPTDRPLLEARRGRVARTHRRYAAAALAN